jgi:hypothetical protein
MGQSQKLPSATRWCQQLKTCRSIYLQLNVVIERNSFVLTPPSLRPQDTSWKLDWILDTSWIVRVQTLFSLQRLFPSSLRPQDTSWIHQTVKRPVPQAVTSCPRARFQEMLPLQRLFPSTPTGSAAVDRP